MNFDLSIGIQPNEIELMNPTSASCHESTSPPPAKRFVISYLTVTATSWSAKQTPFVLNFSHTLSLSSASCIIIIQRAYKCQSADE